MSKKTEDVLIGNRIKEIRAGLNMDQRTFSKKIDATVSALSNWENGRNKPNDIMLNKIAKIGDVTVDYLLNGSLDDYSNQQIVDFEIQLKNDNSINDAVIPFIIRTVSNRISPHSIFAPKSITEVDERLENAKEDAIKRWSDEELIENGVLSILSEDISYLIEDSKKYLYADFYNNNSRISSSNKLSEFGDLKMHFLDKLNNFQRAAFDDIRYNDEIMITNLLNDMDEIIKKRSTMHL